jgi:electron transfer flavoprotein-quinone oxidoreductase
MDERFDCIIVGGGIAGLSAAMTLAQADMRFLLAERGEFFGAKNVSGGVLWGSDLNRLVPDYWEKDAAFERYVSHRRFSFLDPTSAFTIDFKSQHFETKPYSGLIVLRARFDQWLADQVQSVIEAGTQAEESFLATDVLVEELLVEDGRVTGIRAGGEDFFADCVIIAEGVNNLLTRQIGLQRPYVPPTGMATGVKEIIRFDRKVLEDRFQLGEGSGLTNEFLGFASGGVEGGGFLYTNLDSVSVGLVVDIGDLGRKKQRAYDLLNDFKKHPAVAPMLDGGEVVEYSAHVVSSGDLSVMPSQVYGDGVLVAGEAANLVLNSGKAIQGMDFAMHSGILAAETVATAKEDRDFSGQSLARYREALESSYVMQDLRNFQHAVKFLHSPAMFSEVPDVMCEFGRQYFTISNEPSKKAVRKLLDSVKKHSSVWNLLKLGRKAARSL